ncbi:MAG TPA: helix-turn-helix transcriptional regulator [Lachnospiraceae bacterium]|nr:helix-turn-helix transcriptional regulator [Lachnospiraceae bacterium]
MNEVLLSPAEVAEVLKIKKNTVYEMIKRGDLSAKKMGKQFRITSSAVEDYLRQNSQGEEECDSEIVICGQDAILDILCNYISHSVKKVSALRSYLGSYNGLYAMYQGKVDLATAHLWDGETNTYNKEYVKRMLPGVDTVLVHLVNRVEGFYVLKGNPKNITSFESLREPSITMVNRERGSGSRILLDEYLRKFGIPTYQVAGYSREVSSHLAAASVVARGGADLAIGIQKVCLQVPNLDFVPIQEESYDLVMRKEDMRKPVYQTILSIIQSEQFRVEVEGLGGYLVDGMGAVDYI